VSEEANKNVPARNTLVQLLAMYTNPEADSHNTQRYRQTDRQTDDIMIPVAIMLLSYFCLFLPLNGE